LDDFGDATIAVVTFAGAERALAYQREALEPLPVLVDDDRTVYRAYGLGRGSTAAIWGWSTWRAYARLLRAGRRLRRPTEDTHQLGGDFVVDRAGNLAFAFRSQAPDDRPGVDELLAVVRRL
jgi:hypothetical protein